MAKNRVTETVEELCKVGPVSVVEQLKGRRAKILREMTAKLKEFDRMIRLAEETEAEQVMHDAYELLDS